VCVGGRGGSCRRELELPRCVRVPNIHISISPSAWSLPRALNPSREPCSRSASTLHDHALSSRFATKRSQARAAAAATSGGAAGRAKVDTNEDSNTVAAETAAGDELADEDEVDPALVASDPSDRLLHHHRHIGRANLRVWRCKLGLWTSTTRDAHVHVRLVLPG